MTRAAVAFPRTIIEGAVLSDALPSARIRGRSVAVPAWDEDALTLACRAARALGPSPDIERVVLALGQPVDEPRVALWHLNLDDAEFTVLTGAGAGDEALRSAADDTLVLAGTAPRPSSRGPHDVGAAGAALIGPAEAADVPPDVAAVIGRTPGVESVLGAALATKAPATEPMPGTAITWPMAQARRHQLDVVPTWHEAAQGAHVSQAEWDADGPARYRLEVGRHGATTTYPPSSDPPGDVETVPMRGTVAARTSIAPAGAPGEFAEQARSVGAYDVVIVEHDEGFRIIGQVCADTPSPTIGDRVGAELRLLFRQEGAWRYALKWRVE